MQLQETITYVFLFISLYFEIFLLLTYLEKREAMKKEGQIRVPTVYPTVSVIVPCYNEEQTVAKTVMSLLKLDYPKEKLDIIIVNDGSTDHTTQVLKRFAKHSQIRIFHKENGGKYTALNLGLSNSSTQMVGCLDADSFVSKDALKQIVSYFEDKDVMAVVPSVVVQDPTNIVQLIQKVEYNWGILLRKIFSYLGALYITPGPFSIFRREVFDTIGNYKHAHLTEDLEIALRMQKHHYKIVNAHNARIHTVAPKTIKSLYRQRLRWTYGFLKNAIDYRSLFFKKEYGNLGVFALPMATATIFTALYHISMFTVTSLTNVFEEITRVQIMGIKFPSFEFDWFFFDTNITFFITAMLSVMTILLILLGKKLAEGKSNISLDLFYFLLFYPILAPFWLTRALYNTVASRKTSWR